MSGRIRTVKPEWLEDELLASASDSARVLSVALLLMADDYGNGRASLATIATGAWRFDMERDDGERAPETLVKAREALSELVEIGFVTLYVVGKQRYFAVRNWAKHQRVVHPGKPRVPSPEDGEIVGFANVSRDSHEDLARESGDPQDSLAPDLRSPITDHRSPTHACAREEPPRTPTVQHHHVTELYSRLRAEAHQAKHGRPGGTFVRSTKTWQPTEDLCAWANANGGLVALEDSLRGYLGDEWAIGAGWPISTWAKDPGRYQGRNVGAASLPELLARQKLLSAALRAANDLAERSLPSEREDAEKRAEDVRNAKVAVDREIRKLEDAQRRGAA